MIFYLKQVHKSYPNNYIKAIYAYIVLFVFLNSIQFIIIYSQNYLEISWQRCYLECINFSFCIGLLFLFYLMLNILISFRDKSFSRKQNNWIILIAGILILSDVIRTCIPATEALFVWVVFIKKNFRLLSSLIYYIEFIALIGFFFIWPKTKFKKEWIRIARSFILLFIIADAITIFMFHFLRSSKVVEEFRGIIIVFINLMPILIYFIWAKFVFLDYAQKMSNLLIEKDKFEPIYSKYKISKREIEVVELLIDGKSNNEIKEDLFLSYHTVKNHISHIYEKLNVKTRHELVHFFVKIK